MPKYSGQATGFIREHNGRLCLHDEKTDFRLYFAIESESVLATQNLPDEMILLKFEPLHMRLARVKPLEFERLPEEYKPLTFTMPFFTECIDDADLLLGHSRLRGSFGYDDTTVAVGIMPTHEAYFYSAFYDEFSMARADVVVGTFGVGKDWHEDDLYILKRIEYNFSLEEWNMVQKETALALPSTAQDLESPKVKRKPISSRLRYEVLLRDGHRCVDCGASPADDPSVRLEIDHRLPVSKGGTNDIENLQTLCWACNNGKSDSVDHKLNNSLQSNLWNIAA